MTEPKTSGRGGLRAGLGYGGCLVAAVLVAAIAVAALVPQDACACATPLDLVVQNYSGQPASVSWNQPGIFGTPLRGLSGGAEAPSCRALGAGLRKGIVEVSVKTRVESRTFVLAVRTEEAYGSPWVIVVGPNGTVADAGRDPSPGTTPNDPNVALC